MAAPPPNPPCRPREDEDDVPRSNHPSRLLVEGSDDEHALLALLKHHGYKYDRRKQKSFPFVVNLGGKDKILKELPTELKGSFERLGVVIDADAKPLDRWAAVRGHFKEAGIVLPSSLAEEGTVVDLATPRQRIGVWLMPSNREPGALEEFLSQMVPETDSVWDHAKRATMEAEDLGAPFSRMHRSKAIIHCWLAWQNPPGKPYGLALKKKMFAGDSSLARAFVGWFKKVFLDPL